MAISSYTSSRVFKSIQSVVCVCFLWTSILPPAQAQTIFSMPVPGVMVQPTSVFHPMVVKGIQFDPQKPFHFDFLIDQGDETFAPDSFEEESMRLMKYFLASLTVPEDDLWVNLSPYEEDRIIPNAFGITEMGRDLLAQDYLLKQLTASLMYPEQELGQAFWQRVYQKAHQQFGTTNIPINTFSKVWVVPQTARVYERQNAAFVTEAHLKVMLEEDYLALKENRVTNEAPSTITAQVIKDILIPEIEREVNEGAHFAQLRQIYHSLILANWYKERIQQSLLNQVYADQNKVDGVDVEDEDIKNKIYAQYVEAFKKGVYDYIKEDYDPYSQQIIPRKYFSGGFHMQVSDKAQYDGQARDVIANGDLAMISAKFVSSTQGDAAMGSAASSRFVLNNNPAQILQISESISDLVEEAKTTWEIGAEFKALNDPQRDLTEEFERVVSLLELDSAYDRNHPFFELIDPDSVRGRFFIAAFLTLQSIINDEQRDLLNVLLDQTLLHPGLEETLHILEHSMSVALLANYLAVLDGRSKEEKETLLTAAMIHDLGKLNTLPSIDGHYSDEFKEEMSAERKAIVFGSEEDAFEILEAKGIYLSEEIRDIVLQASAQFKSPDERSVLATFLFLADEMDAIVDLDRPYVFRQVKEDPDMPTTSEQVVTQRKEILDKKVANLVGKDVRRIHSSMSALWEASDPILWYLLTRSHERLNELGQSQVRSVDSRQMADAAMTDRTTRKSLNTIHELKEHAFQAIQPDENYTGKIKVGGRVIRLFFRDNKVYHFEFDQQGELLNVFYQDDREHPVEVEDVYDADGKRKGLLIGTPRFPPSLGLGNRHLGHGTSKVRLSGWVRTKIKKGQHKHIGYIPAGFIKIGEDWRILDIAIGGADQIGQVVDVFYESGWPSMARLSDGNIIPIKLARDPFGRVLESGARLSSGVNNHAFALEQFKMHRKKKRIMRGAVLEKLPTAQGWGYILQDPDSHAILTINQFERPRFHVYDPPLYNQAGNIIAARLRERAEYKTSGERLLMPIQYKVMRDIKTGKPVSSFSTRGKFLLTNYRTSLITGQKLDGLGRIDIKGKRLSFGEKFAFSPIEILWLPEEDLFLVDVLLDKDRVAIPFNMRFMERIEDVEGLKRVKAAAEKYRLGDYLNDYIKLQRVQLYRELTTGHSEVFIYSTRLKDLETIKKEWFSDHSERKLMAESLKFGLTKKDIALFLGIDESHFSKKLRGEYNGISNELKRKWRRLLNYLTEMRDHPEEAFRLARSINSPTIDQEYVLAKLNDFLSRKRNDSELDYVLVDDSFQIEIKSMNVSEEEGGFAPFVRFRTMTRDGRPRSYAVLFPLNDQGEIFFNEAQIQRGVRVSEMHARVVDVLEERAEEFKNGRIHKITFQRLYKYLGPYFFHRFMDQYRGSLRAFIEMIKRIEELLGEKVHFYSMMRTLTASGFNMDYVGNDYIVYSAWMEAGIDVESEYQDFSKRGVNQRDAIRRIAEEIHQKNIIINGKIFTIKKVRAKVKDVLAGLGWFDEDVKDNRLISVEVMTRGNGAAVSVDSLRNYSEVRSPEAVFFDDLEEDYAVLAEESDVLADEAMGDDSDDQNLEVISGKVVRRMADGADAAMDAKSRRQLTRLSQKWLLGQGLSSHDKYRMKILIENPSLDEVGLSDYLLSNFLSQVLDNKKITLDQLHKIPFYIDATLFGRALPTVSHLRKFFDLADFSDEERKKALSLLASEQVPDYLTDIKLYFKHKRIQRGFTQVEINSKGIDAVSFEKYRGLPLVHSVHRYADILSFLPHEREEAFEILAQQMFPAYLSSANEYLGYHRVRKGYSTQDMRSRGIRLERLERDKRIPFISSIFKAAEYYGMKEDEIHRGFSILAKQSFPNYEVDIVQYLGYLRIKNRKTTTAMQRLGVSAVHVETSGLTPRIQTVRSYIEILDLSEKEQEQALHLLAKKMFPQYKSNIRHYLGYHRVRANFTVREVRAQGLRPNEYEVFVPMKESTFFNFAKFYNLTRNQISEGLLLLENTRAASFGVVEADSVDAVMGDDSAGQTREEISSNTVSDQTNNVLADEAMGDDSDDQNLEVISGKVVSGNLVSGRDGEVAADQAMTNLEEFTVPNSITIGDANLEIRPLTSDILENDQRYSEMLALLTRINHLSLIMSWELVEKMNNDQGFLNPQFSFGVFDQENVLVGLAVRQPIDDKTISFYLNSIHEDYEGTVLARWLFLYATEQIYQQGYTTAVWYSSRDIDEETTRSMNFDKRLGAEIVEENTDREEGVVVYRWTYDIPKHIEALRERYAAKMYQEGYSPNGEIIDTVAMSVAERRGLMVRQLREYRLRIMGKEFEASREDQDQVFKMVGVNENTSMAFVDKYLKEYTSFYANYPDVRPDIKKSFDVFQELRRLVLVLLKQNSGTSEDPFINQEIWNALDETVQAYNDKVRLVDQEEELSIASLLVTAAAGSPTDVILAAQINQNISNVPESYRGEVLAVQAFLLGSHFDIFPLHEEDFTLDLQLARYYIHQMSLLDDPLSVDKYQTALVRLIIGLQRFSETEKTGVYRILFENIEAALRQLGLASIIQIVDNFYKADQQADYPVALSQFNVFKRDKVDSEYSQIDILLDPRNGNHQVGMAELIEGDSDRRRQSIDYLYGEALSWLRSLKTDQAVGDDSDDQNLEVISGIVVRRMADGADAAMGDEDNGQEEEMNSIIKVNDWGDNKRGIYIDLDEEIKIKDLILSSASVSGSILYKNQERRLTLKIRSAGQFNGEDLYNLELADSDMDHSVGRLVISIDIENQVVSGSPLFVHQSLRNKGYAKLMRAFTKIWLLANNYKGFVYKAEFDASADESEYSFRSFQSIYSVQDGMGGDPYTKFAVIASTDELDQVISKSRDYDSAMEAPNDVGGIDFTRARMDIQIDRDESGMPIPFTPQQLETLDIPGLVPVILNIQPVTNLPLILGMVDDEGHPISKNPVNYPEHLAREEVFFHEEFMSEQHS